MHQKLDENNSNQQVQYGCYNLLGTPAYILYMVCSYVELNAVLVADGDTTSAVSNKRRSSTKIRMECGIADETSMSPLKCECFGSAA